MLLFEDNLQAIFDVTNEMDFKYIVQLICLFDDLLIE
jgi:hypothetical protein